MMSRYEPQNAVKLWASGRFSRLEDHVQLMLKDHPNWGMHNEWFLMYTLFPAMRQQDAEIVEDDLCGCLSGSSARKYFRTKMWEYYRETTILY